MGVDPGSRQTGWAVIDVVSGRAQHIASGTLNLGAGELAERLKKIFLELQQLVQQYQPAEFAIEQAFMSRNADSALKLGQARGAAICVAAVSDLPVAEYAPRAVKQSVAGTGAASKQQIQTMVSALLELPLAELQADQADALAVALTHMNYRTLGPLLDSAGKAQLRKGRAGKRTRGRAAWRAFGANL